MLIRNKRRYFFLFISPVLCVLLIDLFFPFKVAPSYSTIVMASDGTIIDGFLNKEDKWRFSTEIEEITPLLRQTLLYKEDKYFYYHFGFNPISIVRAAARNMSTGRRTSGASTITMQVVRLLQPQKRTYFNKLIEVFRAIQLELHFSKNEILQLYLNLIPYGGNIEGIKSASLLYFNKPPQLLSLAEITTLTIIPNRPSSLRLGRNNQLIITERNKWLMMFKNKQLFDNQTINAALLEPININRHQILSLAPHFSRRIKQENLDKAIIKTTLNQKLQLKVQLLVKNYIDRLRTQNIHNAAVLIINNQRMQVEAYIGSADFYNNYDGGQVDGVRAVRSPGSTLKPILYALAFDQGIITPKTMLNDVPTNFGGYEPENFDRQFNGKVSANFALANSLNIPAVKLLKDISPTLLIETLKKYNFKTIKKQSKDLGLSMILGGCGVTLEELTTQYASLANGGKIFDMNYIYDAKKQSINAALSPEATYLVTDILTQVSRPDLPNNFDNTYHLPKIAWKTGTSFGKKDAWSIGYNKKYTVGVWVGNFSGVGVPELSGANTATPLLFQLFNSIDYNSTQGWFKPTAHVIKRKVCAESGQIPNDFCSHQVLDYAIMGISTTKRCEHLKWVFTDTKQQISYCTQCLPDSGYERNLYPNLAPELIAFYDIKQIPYRQIPPHNPTCTRVWQQGAPTIISPNDGSEYYLENQQMQLACQVANDVKEVYWYLNDKLIAKEKPQKPVFIKPPLGKIKISCSDDKGRNVDIFIKVLSP